MYQDLKFAAKHTVSDDSIANSDSLLGQLGNLKVRLAKSDAEIEASQRLRFSIFHGEFNAELDEASMRLEKDHDNFDQYCDHLIVIDTQLKGTEADRIVGTYRLMRKKHAKRAGGYYSAEEFAIAGLIARHKKRNFLELGRSCVLPAYRGKRTIELLWQGIWAYARQYEIDVMIGCASFAGTIPAEHAEALTFLQANAIAKDDWHVAPLPGKHVSMDLMPVEAVKLKAAITKLPPLIKGYLRLGATFGDGAVIDYKFRSIDVLVVLPVENIHQRYKAHYGDNAERYAA